MAKANLNDLIAWLKLDEKNRFEIYDLDKNESIQKCASYNDLSQNALGTPNGYFEDLADKGIRTVQIVKKRKNGSTYVREGCGLNFGISTDANNNVVAASGLPDRPAATQQHYPQPSSMGLGSPSMGLGFPEIMEMRSQSDRFKETKEENTLLRSRLERLEKENRELENQNLTYKLGSESKPSAVDKLVEGIAANPAALSQIIQSFKGSAPGLNSPAKEAPKLSDTKSKVVDTISSPGISDKHVAGAYYALVQYASNNIEFVKQYEQLLINHNIIENGSNSDSDGV